MGLRKTLYVIWQGLMDPSLHLQLRRLEWERLEQIKLKERYNVLSYEEEAMRHTDTKTEFETGAHRDSDEGKGRPSLISPVLIHRLGVHLAEGAKHYGEDNWSKGMPYRRTADSMIRHMGQWLARDEGEDHLAAIAFGVMCLMTFEEDVKLHCNMDDRDVNLEKILPSLLTSSDAKPRLKVASVHESVDAFVKSQSVQEILATCKGGCGGMTYQKDEVCLVCKSRYYPGKNQPNEST